MDAAGFGVCRVFYARCVGVNGIMRSMMNDEQIMQMALSLAGQGRGRVEPNPMVGAVIVREGVVLGQGYHQQFGGPHAEREALADAQAAGHDVTGATIYVTLEPCCHVGKTPPCTDALIASGVSRVVIAMVDPDDRVAGQGAAQLEQVGVEVTVGVCESAARELLAPYIMLRTQHRPWVIGKWAQTRDGYWALPVGAGRWISNDASRADAHRVRGACDAITVGIGTVLADDPQLTARGDDAAHQPARVVLDSQLRTPPGCRLLQTTESPVIIAASEATLLKSHDQAESLRGCGAQVLGLPAEEGDWVSPAALLRAMGDRQWTHVLVEGGPAVMGAFLRAGLVDELQVYVAPFDAKGPDSDATELALLPHLDVAKVARDYHFTCIGEQAFGDDRKCTYWSSV
jgi:diaminohydroxyphosphoribosylaminopyrimidine deaminase / 5-amino-6-(5-phosphoribosylamino)uracil reductase